MAVLLLAHSLVLALLAALVSVLLPRAIAKRRLERERVELISLWPEIIDHIISGLNSGLSLAETLVGLSSRGPLATRETFQECERILRQGQDFEEIFLLIKERFHDGLADQVCEVLDFARGTGGRDTSIILRSLGDFIRSDISLRAEIRAKHGWIKNSALIAAAAPWILLLILSSQKNTIQAFSTPGGVGVLSVGIAMTVVAYFWMERVGRLPEVPRIFA
jgi:tight adherence protein B